MSIKKIALSSAATTMAVHHAPPLLTPSRAEPQCPMTCSGEKRRHRRWMYRNCHQPALDPGSKTLPPQSPTAHLLHTGVEKTGVDGTEEAYHAPTGDIALVRNVPPLRIQVRQLPRAGY